MTKVNVYNVPGGEVALCTPCANEREKCGERISRPGLQTRGATCADCGATQKPYDG